MPRLVNLWWEVNKAEQAEALIKTWLPTKIIHRYNGYHLNELSASIVIVSAVELEPLLKYARHWGEVMFIYPPYREFNEPSEFDGLSDIDLFSGDLGFWVDPPLEVLGSRRMILMVESCEDA